MPLIPGSVSLTGFIAPTDSADTFAVTNPIYGLGGIRMVPDLTSLSAITSQRREPGMLVYVSGETTYYKLESGLTNSDWTVFSSGGGSGFSGWTGSSGVNSIIANNPSVNISGNYSIVGGKANSATTAYSFIGAGTLNFISSTKSFIGGGQSNSIVGARTTYSSIAGGYGNTINNNTSGSFVGGGIQNKILGANYSFIGSGVQNKVANYYSSVVGGALNSVYSFFSTIVGGSSNWNYASNGFIGGGQSNSASTFGSIIVGGRKNISSGGYSSVVNGYKNKATGVYSSVLGGMNNVASGMFSSILAGSAHTVSGHRSAVIGGSGINGSTNDTVYIPNARLAETIGTIIYSAGTPLEQIFVSAAALNDYIPITGTTSPNVVTGNIEFANNNGIEWNGGSEGIVYNSNTQNVDMNATNGFDFANGPILSAGTPLTSIFVTNTQLGGYLPTSGGTGGPYVFTGDTSTQGLTGTTIRAIEFFSMSPYTGANPSVIPDDSVWFYSGVTGSITLNYRVAGVTKSVELS